jgi:DNA-binding SARP family transcriptional activator/TolB-like protein
MIRLNTLGTPTLQRDDGPTGAGATQRRPLAVLALLAVAGERGMTRDKIIAYLWPERSDERARHVLAQTLYALRRDSGAEVVLGTSDLRLNPATIRSDVAEFEAAVARGDADHAAALYGGAFLDGFYINEASDFERWAETERMRLRALARLAFERAARDASARLDHHRAVEWWRRVATLDPLDGPAVVGLIQALAAVGDRSGALRHASVYEALAHEELGVPPDAAVSALVEHLRTSVTPVSVRRDPEYWPHQSLTPSSLTLHDLTDGAGEAERDVPAGRRQVRGWPRRAVAPATAMVLALAALAALGARAILNGRASGAGAKTLVSAVGAVRDYSGSDSSGIARALTDMLATNLARVPNVLVVSNARIYEILGRQQRGGELAAQLSSAARQAGAVEIVEGTLFRHRGEVLRFDVRRVDLATGAIRKAYSVEGTDPFELVDRATAEFASDVSPGQAANLRIAEVTTRSLVAYRFYEQGLHAYYQQNDVPSARRLFLAAFAEDSTFAMAEYYVANCETLLGIPTAVDRFAHAARLADRSTDRERLLIRATAGYYWNEPSSRTSAESLATRYPAEPDGHFLLGQALTWGGDFLAGVPHLRRVVEMDSSSLRGASQGCRACNALDAMVTSYWLADSMAASERVAREWTRLQPGSPRAWAALSWLLSCQGRDAQARDAIRMSNQLTGTGDSWRTDVLAAIRGGDFAAADSILGRPGFDEREGDALWFQTLSLRYQGRLADALAITRQRRRHEPATSRAATMRLAEAIVLFEMGRFREAAAGFDVIAATPSFRPELAARIARDRAWNLTHAATALAAGGDIAAVARLADSIQYLGAMSNYGRDQRLHHYVRGLLLRTRGQLPEAAEELRRGIFSLTDGYTRNSYELARTLLALRRPADAIAILRPAFHGSLQGSNTYITHTELHETIAHAFDEAGQPDSAAVHYRYVVRAWAAADAPFRARWESARTRLAVLSHGN